MKDQNLNQWWGRETHCKMGGVVKHIVRWGLITPPYMGTVQIQEGGSETCLDDEGLNLSRRWGESCRFQGLGSGESSKSQPSGKG